MRNQKIMGVLVTVFALANLHCSQQGFKASSSGSSELVLSAPQLSLSGSVPALINQRSLTVSYSLTTDSRAGQGSVLCTLNGSAIACGQSMLSLTSLVDGNYALVMTGRDGRGNLAEPVSVTFQVDGTAPVVTITQSPPASSPNTTASFTFSAADSGAGVAAVECQLDSQAYQACSTTASYSSLSVAAHEFRIRAIDVAGNQQIVTYNFAVISTAPPPPPGPSSIRLAWDPNSEAQLAGYRIRYGTTAGSYTQVLDAGLPATISGAVSFTVPNLVAGQQYFFVVTAYDSAGAQSPVSNQVAASAP